MSKNNSSTKYSVSHFEDLGYEVQIRHDRVLDDSGKFKPKGGYTIVSLKDEQNTFIGVAACSKKETYDKKKGVRIALGRAAKGRIDYISSGNPFDSTTIVTFPNLKRDRDACRVASLAAQEVDKIEGDDSESMHFYANV